MAQELTGLEYLKKKEIKNMKCNMEKPFAFISYSHDDHDSQIVMNVFMQLMRRGHNLWIDTANMPADEHSWKKSARDALRNKNCKLAFFFRSESSMVKDTIAKELKTIIVLKHIKSIVTVDIWHDENMDADRYYRKVMNDETKDGDSCDLICECISTECKAIRLAGDAGNDILSLVEEMEEELRAIEGIATDSSDGDVVMNDLDDNGEDESDEGYTDEEAVNENDSDDEDVDPIPKTAGETGGTTIPGKKKSEFSDGYHYYIFGVEYNAGRREQANLMYDTFEALSTKHPEKVMDIVKKCTSVSKKDDVSDAGTRNARPPYFRMCKEFIISGEEYAVGASYGFEAKIAEIYRMIDACAEDRSIFELEGFEQKKKKDKSDSVSTQSDESQNAGFGYMLWGVLHTAKKMSDMIHDVFDLIAEKYPEKIPELAASDYISSVARKEDVDGRKLSPGKLNYFRASREHNVGNRIYYVGTSYNRSQGIGQLERMLKICEGSAEGLNIISSPERISHTGGRTGKKGIGELL